MKIQSVRGRAAAAVVTGLALVGAGAALPTAPARSAVVPGDCAAAYPTDELGSLPRGAAVRGLTVVQGTEPVEFAGTYLGAVSHGIAPGLDMLMVEVDFGSQALNDIGIWQGMSGSPVYAGDGRLIGAVAYGLAFGPSTVAGVTPFDAMDEYLTGPVPNQVAVGDRQARTIARATDVTAAQAGAGFAQLPMRTGLSGVSRSRLRTMKRRGPDYLRLRGVRAAGGGAAAAAAGPEHLVAGGNLGAAFSYGDITAGGVGTVTSVCDDRLVGFGHPMNFSGATRLGMMPADAVYIQGDPVGPGFKVANIGRPVGTIDQDRLTGISGDLGVLPEETDVTSTVSYGRRARTGTSHALAPEYNAGVTFSQVLANHDRVVDAITGGSETAAVAITGTDATDQPFRVDFADRYTSRSDISFESIFDTADLVFALSRMPRVTVSGVTSTVQVTDSRAAWRVAALQQRRGGAWVTVDRSNPALARAGGRVRLRTLLRKGRQSRWVRLAVEVPDGARRHGALSVTGGASTFGGVSGRARTPAALLESLAGRVRNDQVEATVSFFRRGPDPEAGRVSRPQSHVVRGSEQAELLLRR